MMDPSLPVLLVWRPAWSKEPECVRIDRDAMSEAGCPKINANDVPTTSVVQRLAIGRALTDRVRPVWHAANSACAASRINMLRRCAKPMVPGDPALLKAVYRILSSARVKPRDIATA